MANCLRHRGPDDEGLAFELDGRVALAHRRLSIVDLSAAGHQPMESSDGRWLLSFNGEIYNHLDIRAELERVGHHGWRGHSDTETLVEAIARWGIEQTLRKSAGMFAISLWDRQRRELVLARDRFGEKPLYYGWSGNAFLFASELKALKIVPGFDRDVDRNALALLLARTYIPAPLTIYQGVYKLEPGCMLTVGEDVWKTPAARAPRAGSPSPVKITRFWTYRDKVAAGLENPFTDEGEALNALEASLARAIGEQSVADVPVGAFLSGGIDSSTIVALYRQHGAGTVRTFTVGFEESAFDEAPYARAVAKHFGTEHHETRVSSDEARDVIPELSAMYDEPFADSSQIPTFLVSRFASGSVKVALTGDGGDELFGGYNRHVSAPRMWAAMGRLPRGIRRPVGNLLGSVPASQWQWLINRLAGWERSPHLGTKLQRTFRTLGGANDLGDVYTSFIDEWGGGENPVIGAGYASIMPDLDLPVEAGDPLRMMYADAMGFLPDDILCKVDRASMAVSLETRVPFLDHRVAEVAARIPLSMKISGGSGKLILRKLLDRHAPSELFDRPKTGFGIPVGQWLRGPLRSWAEQLLDPERMRRENYIDPDPIHRRWKAHLDGRIDATQSLWPVLMFQSWLDDERALYARRAA